MGNTGGKINTHLLIPRRILSVLVWDSLPPRLGLRFLAASPFFSFFCSSEHCVRFIFIFHSFVSPSSCSGYFFCFLSYALILPLPPLPVSLPIFLLIPSHLYSHCLPFLSSSASLTYSHLFSLSLIPSSSCRCFLHRKRICASSPKAEFALCFLIAKMISICFASRFYLFLFLLFSVYSRYHHKEINAASLYPSHS